MLMDLMTQQAFLFQILLQFHKIDPVCATLILEQILFSTSWKLLILQKYDIQGLKFHFFCHSCMTLYYSQHHHTENDLTHSQYIDKNFICTISSYLNFDCFFENHTFQTFGLQQYARAFVSFRVTQEKLLFQKHQDVKLRS